MADWWQSKTLWSGVSIILGALFKLFGIDIDQEHYADAMWSLAALIFGVGTVIGRIDAERPERRWKK